jgi:hypothetical protein
MLSFWAVCVCGEMSSLYGFTSPPQIGTLSELLGQMNAAIVKKQSWLWEQRLLGGPIEQHNVLVLSSPLVTGGGMPGLRSCSYARR